MSACENIGVAHGAWGERVAVEYLRRRGLMIVERNVRPVEKDRRLEIDLVAYDGENDTVVFVEVKQHARVRAGQRRLRALTKRKRENLRRACWWWRRVRGWEGSYRFDVVEVYGVPEGGGPVIDHICGVELFAASGRFVKWH